MHRAGVGEIFHVQDRHSLLTATGYQLHPVKRSRFLKGRREEGERRRCAEHWATVSSVEDIHILFSVIKS